jgi:UDP-N-acetyl-2-amino-2-deoxyglucuronate dehydrogenase
MFSDSGIQAVVLCLPNWVYPDVIVSAAENGIHVLKEKPLGRDCKEALSFVELMEKKNLKFAVATQRRFSSAFTKGREYLKEIGEIFMVSCRLCFDGELFLGQASGWRGDRQKAGGGALLDLGYHYVDLINWYVGLPQEVFAFYGKKAKPNFKYDTDDSAVCIFRYENGAIGYLVTSWASGPTDDRIMVHGTKGSVEATWEAAILRKPSGEEISHSNFKNDFDEIYKAQSEYFCRSVLENTEPMTSGRQNLADMQFIDAAYASVDTGKPVKIDRVV